MFGNDNKRTKKNNKGRCQNSSNVVTKDWFHEPTNHIDERDKTADDPKKLIGVTNLIGRANNLVWSFHGTMGIAILVADQSNFFNLQDWSAARVAPTANRRRLYGT